MRNNGLLRFYTRLVKGWRQRVRDLRAQETDAARQIVRKARMRATAKVGVYKRKLQEQITKTEVQLYGQPRWHKQKESSQ